MTAVRPSKNCPRPGPSSSLSLPKSCLGSHSPRPQAIPRRPDHLGIWWNPRGSHRVFCMVYLPTVGAPKEPIFKMDGNGETPGIWSHPIQKWLFQGTRNKSVRQWLPKKNWPSYMPYGQKQLMSALWKCVQIMNHRPKHLSTQVLYILAPPNGLMEKLQIHLYCAVL